MKIQYLRTGLDYLEKYLKKEQEMVKKGHLLEWKKDNQCAMKVAHFVIEAFDELALYLSRPTDIRPGTCPFGWPDCAGKLRVIRSTRRKR
jgi:hypothetical protein